jgi:hypothetical protein
MTGTLHTLPSIYDTKKPHLLRLEPPAHLSRSQRSRMHLHFQAKGAPTLPPAPTARRAVGRAGISLLRPGILLTRPIKSLELCGVRNTGPHAITKVTNTVTPRWAPPANPSRSHDLWPRRTVAKSSRGECLRPVADTLDSAVFDAASPPMKAVVWPPVNQTGER